MRLSLVDDESPALLPGLAQLRLWRGMALDSPLARWEIDEARHALRIGRFFWWFVILLVLAAAGPIAHAIRIHSPMPSWIPANFLYLYLAAIPLYFALIWLQRKSAWTKRYKLGHYTEHYLTSLNAVEIIGPTVLATMSSLTSALYRVLGTASIAWVLATTMYLLEIYMPSNMFIYIVLPFVLIWVLLPLFGVLLLAESIYWETLRRTRMPTRAVGAAFREFLFFSFVFLIFGIGVPVFMRMADMWLIPLPIIAIWFIVWPLYLSSIVLRRAQATFAKSIEGFHTLFREGAQEGDAAAAVPFAPSRARV